MTAKKQSSDDRFTSPFRIFIGDEKVYDPDLEAKMDGVGTADDAAMMAYDDFNWAESKHPRAANGQFGSGGGGAKSEGPKDVSGWKQISGKLGSNPGGKYHDESGQAHYVKQSKSNDHAKNEVLASKLYHVTGAPTVAPKLVNVGGGKLGTASKWQNNEGNIDPHNPAHRMEAGKHFAAHAWLANWDAVGATHDNQARVGGKMTTMDVGGALKYRAQGKEKGSAFGNKVHELNTMRDEDVSHQNASIFGQMEESDLRASALRVASIPDQTIHDLVNEHGPGDAAEKHALAEKLIARRDHIKEVYQIKDAEFEGMHQRDENGHFISGPGQVDAPVEAPVVEAPKGNLPAPHPLSKTQVEMHKIANSDMEHSAKVDALSTHLGLSAPGGTTAKYGEKLLKAMGAAPNPLVGSAKKLPDPHPLSKVQVAMHNTANSDMDHAQKVAVIQNQLKGQSPGGSTDKYGQKLLSALGPAPSEPTGWGSVETDTPDTPAITDIAAPDPHAPVKSFMEFSQSVLHPDAPTSNANSDVQFIKDTVMLDHKLSTAQKVDQLKSYKNSYSDDPESVAFIDKCLKELAPAAPAAPAVSIPAPPSNGYGVKKVYELATGSMTKSDKIAQVKSMTAGLSNQVVQEYTSKVLDALNALPDDPVAEPPPAPTAGLVQAPPSARRTRLEAIYDNAAKPTSTQADGASEIAPSLSKTFWGSVPAEAKSAVVGYTNSDYTSINSALRAGTTDNAWLVGQINHIDELFEHGSATLTKDVVLKRGENMPSGIIDQLEATLKSGLPCVYQKEGFISASMSSKAAFSQKNTILEIVARKGIKALGVDAVSGHTENEMLMRHGQSFDIVEIERGLPGGKTRIRMVSN